LARAGILLKGGVYLEAMASVNAIVFDKTGTLTKGALRLTSVHPVGAHTAEDVLETAAAAESGSEHLLARAVVEGAAARGLVAPRAEEFRALPGLGGRATVRRRSTIVGSPRFLASQSVTMPPEAEAIVGLLERNGETPLIVAEDDTVIGLIGLQDELREGARDAVQHLRELGIQRVVL